MDALRKDSRLPVVDLNGTSNNLDIHCQLRTTYCNQQHTALHHLLNIAAFFLDIVGRLLIRQQSASCYYYRQTELFSRLNNLSYGPINL